MKHARTLIIVCALFITVGGCAPALFSVESIDARDEIEARLLACQGAYSRAHTTCRAMHDKTNQRR